MDPDQDAPTSRRSHHGRPFLIVASLAPFVTVMAFLWFRSEGVAAASGEDAATIARIVCRGGTTTIETPIVRARSDGVHLEIAADVEGLKFSVENDHGGTEGWELTPSTTYPFAWTSWLPPGKVRAQCGTSAGVADGPAFEVIDPEGLWHDNHLWCVETDDFDSRGGRSGSMGT